MSTELSRVFEDSRFGQVRVVMRDGEPWFVAADVCAALEHTNPTMALSSLDEDERAKESLGRQGDTNLVSEAGLYALIFRSNKANAKEFSRWVRKEVLPSIRKSGQYSLDPEMPAASALEQLRCMREVLETAYVGNQLTLALDKCCKRLTGMSALETADIQLIAPQKSQLLTPTEIGKMLVGEGEKPIGPRQVNQILLQLGLQRSVAGKWEPIGEGTDLSEMLDTGKKHGDGTPVRQLKWLTDIVERVRAALTD